ncbi:MAG: hypothetical protein ABIC82_00115 [bacterium]
MCLQSYYNQNNQKLELDLLSEIREVGVREWNRKVEAERRKVEIEAVGFSKHSNMKK